MASQLQMPEPRRSSFGPRGITALFTRCVCKTASVVVDGETVATARLAPRNDVIYACRAADNDVTGAPVEY